MLLQWRQAVETLFFSALCINYGNTFDILCSRTSDPEQWTKDSGRHEEETWPFSTLGNFLITKRVRVLYSSTTVSPLPGSNKSRVRVPGFNTVAKSI